MKFSFIVRAVLTVGIGMLPMIAQAAVWPVSATESDIQADTQVVADGYSQAKVRIIVRDKLDQFLAGKNVLVQFSKSDGEIVLADKNTDAMGRVEFSVRSTSAGIVQVTALVDGIRLTDAPVIVFVEPVGCALGMSRNIALVNSNVRDTTYYYGRDCKRHAFPEHAYESWFELAATDAQPISVEAMSGIKLGTNVVYRPGTLIRFQDSPRVYVATNGGVLRPLADESAAVSVFGAAWSSKVRVISVGYFITSVFGREIKGSQDVDLASNGIEIEMMGI